MRWEVFRQCRCFATEDWGERGLRWCECGATDFGARRGGFTAWVGAKCSSAACLTRAPEIPFIVLDARHPKRDVERFLRRFDRGAWVDCEFEIHDPSRIPDTAEEDSIVGFALEMSRHVCARPLGDQHPDSCA